MKWLCGVVLSFALAQSALAAEPVALATPEARVRAFIADYFSRHGQSTRIIAAGDFDAWLKVIDGLDQAHFVAGAHRSLDNSMSSSADHHPDTEKITATSTQGDVAQVQTHDPQASVTRFYEYELRQVAGDWRIVSLRGYVESPDEAFMTPTQQQRFQNPNLLALRALPKEEARFNGNELFAGKVAVRRVGTLNASTGVLVVGDLGYDPEILAPLGQRVPPGQYPVEISIADKHVAALRVLLSSQPVVKWHPADMGKGGHVVGVDAGNVAISDVSALLTIKTRQKEKQLEKFAQDSNGLTAATMLTLVKPDDCVVAFSGYGDGEYPVYWGVDRSGKPAVLVVDMLVLGN